MKKMKITIEIEDETGEVLVKRESEREVPYMEEFREQGFRGAFHDYETAILEGRKEASDGITSEYLEYLSEKKREMRVEIEKILKESGTK